MKKTLEIQIKDYEKPIKELIGKTVSEIYYYELEYENGQTYWDEKEYHTLDFGLEMIMSDLEKFYFIWDSELAQFNVKFKKGDITTEFSENSTHKKHNVSNNELWSELMKSKIIGISSHWSHWQYLSQKEPNYYPQNIKLDFENDKSVWISATEIENDNPKEMADNITIIFDKRVAKKYNIGEKTV